MIVLAVFHFVFSIVKYPLRCIYHYYVENVKACFSQFDPIVECLIVDESAASFSDQIAAIQSDRARSDKAKRKYFFLGFFAFFINFVDTLYHLYLNDMVYDNINSPIYELFSHKMYPIKFWYHADMIIFAVTIWDMVIYLNLWLNPWLESRYYMYLVHRQSDDSTRLLVNGKEWDAENTKAICEYHRKSQRSIRIGMAITFTVLQGYFTWFFKYKGTKDPAMIYFGWKNILHYGIYQPHFLFFSQFGVILLFFHFFNVSHYVIIKQKFALDRMGKLISRIVQAKNESISFECYREFLRINEQLAYQLTEIRGYNKFWTNLLSCHFSCDMMLFCYMLYSALFIEASAQELTYFYFFMSEMCLLIFSVIYRCSIVDNNNDFCYKRNVQLCILLQLHFRYTPQRLTNIETISTNKNFSRCCFRLKNNYRLDSSAFNLAMYIMSTFFLMMCRKKSKLSRD